MTTKNVICVNCGCKTTLSEVMKHDPEGYYCKDCFPICKKRGDFKSVEENMEEDLQPILSQPNFESALSIAFIRFDPDAGPCLMGENIYSGMDPKWASRLITEIKTKYKVSLADISKALGVNLRTASRWEKGLCGPSNHTLNKIQSNKS